jgi:O-antigen/teichoic acid export membrane protein
MTTSAIGPPSQIQMLSGTLRRLVDGRETWALADQAIVSATNFLTNVIVARYLGLTEFGVFALAWMSILFISGLQMALIVAPMMSLGPKTDPEDRKSYYGAVIVQEALFVLISAVLMISGLHLLATWTHEPGLEKLTIPLCVTTVAYLLQDFVRRYLFTTKQSRRALLNDAVSCLPQLPLIFLLLHWRLIATPGVLWIIALTSLAGVALGIYWYEPVSFTEAAIRRVAVRHWGMSRWLAPSAVFSWTSLNIFVLMAPVYYGAMAAGVLRASQNLVAVTHIWFLGLDNVLPSETARILHHEGIASASHYLRRMSLRWGGLTTVFLGALALAPDFWLRSFYGVRFVGYGYLLRYYAIAYLFVFFGRVLSAALRAFEHTAPIFWSYLTVTVFALATVAPITKHFGLRGVMIGTVASQVMFQSILLVSVVRQRRLRDNGSS